MAQLYQFSKTSWLEIVSCLMSDVVEVMVSHCLPYHFPRFSDAAAVWGSDLKLRATSTIQCLRHPQALSFTICDLLKYDVLFITLIKTFRRPVLPFYMWPIYSNVFRNYLSMIRHRALLEDTPACSTFQKFEQKFRQFGLPLHPT